MSNTALGYRNAELKELVYAAGSGIHGTGLFANRDIAPGEYIGTYWGPETRRNGAYVLWVYDAENEETATGRSGRNLLRYLNHAEDCNAEFDEYHLYATELIRKGTEITFDYGSGFLPDE